MLESQGAATRHAYDPEPLGAGARHNYIFHKPLHGVSGFSYVKIKANVTK
ncbi:hypothetical protein MLOOGBEN_04185 [Bacillus sp. EB106-08-02-XG196]|nr:hypothetical protein [Bacillus sp. EB106-08-02-XG196]NWQ39894.1 hypothetical protein [Bacillus sp. EB106-08-02-XG196]